MKKFILLLSLSAMTMGGYAQNDDINSPKKIQERIEQVERKNNYLQEDYSRLNLKYIELEKKSKDLEIDMKDNEPILENLKWVLGCFGAGTLFAFLWSIFFFLPKKINAKVDAEISRILTDRKSDFIEMLKDYDHEKGAKQKYRIKLLTHKNGSESYIHDLLIKNGFEVSSETKLESLHDAKVEKGDVVFINSDGGVWTKDEIQAYFHQLDNYSFYFGSERIDLTGKHKTRFAAANIQTQFIGNLLNLLKYN